MTRPRGFAPWNPQAKSLALLAQIDAILAEYENYLPLTIRQVFFRCVPHCRHEMTKMLRSAPMTGLTVRAAAR